jgi:hypothetical protein
LDWSRALQACSAWSEDESFSIIPAGLGSFIGSVVGNYDAAKRFCEQGLEANPNDVGLTNNLTVASIFSGDLEMARQQHARLATMTKTSQETAIFLATSGLASLYYGDLADGRLLREKAIELATENNDKLTVAYAAAFWAKAEISLGHPASRAIEIFERESKSLVQPEILYFKKSLLPSNG